MPTYVYRCTECDRVFEVMQRVSDEPMKSCEVCGGSVNKVIHPAGVLFKGSGFYVNDSGSKGGSASTPSNGDGSSKGSDSKGKSESTSSSSESS